MMITLRHRTPVHDLSLLPWLTRAGHALRRFLRTPKGLMLLVLLVLAALAATALGPIAVLPALVGAVVAATLFDALWLWLVHGQWQAPTGALLTGLFVALILDPRDFWLAPICAAVLAVNSKWLVRTRHANVFNPAAVGLVAATLLFGSGQSWWGALPDLPPIVIGVLLAAVVGIAQRVNKLPMVVAFLGVFFTIFTGVALVGDSARFAELFRVPMVNALLFFAGFMLTDPPTSPARSRDQLVYAAIVAVSCAAIYLTTRSVTFLPLGLLVGNAWEAGRRWTVARRRVPTAPAG